MVDVTQPLWQGSQRRLGHAHLENLLAQVPYDDKRGDYGDNMFVACIDAPSAVYGPLSGYNC